MQKLAAQLKSSQGFGLLGLIVIGLLLLAIPLGIYLTRTQQLNKSKAYQPPPVSAPDLSVTLVSDKGLYSPGDNVRVSVYVRNEIEAANLYVVKLKFPTDLLNFVSLDKSPSSSFVQTWTEELVDNTAGSVSLVTELQNLAGSGNSGYRSPANQQYGAKLAELNFTAKTTGLKAITFDDTATEPTAIYSVATNTNILTSKRPVNIEITTQPSATPAPTPTPIVSTPTPTPTVAPTPTPSAQPIYTAADPKAVATPYTTLTLGDLSGVRSRFNLTTTDALRADINGDGSINNFDRSNMLCELGKVGSLAYTCTATPAPSSTPSVAPTPSPTPRSITLNLGYYTEDPDPAVRTANGRITIERTTTTSAGWYKFKATGGMGAITGYMKYRLDICSYSPTSSCSTFSSELYANSYGNFLIDREIGNSIKLPADGKMALLLYDDEWRYSNGSLIPRCGAIPCRKIDFVFPTN